jgi:polyferredoxin
VKSRTLKQRLLGGGFLLLLAAGWRYPLVGYFIPGCMLLGVGTALFRGRSWCNWLCPRGSFEDAWLARFSRGRAIPSAFRSTPLRVAVMAVLLGMLTWQLIRRWPDPYAIGAFFMLLLSLTTVAAVILGLFYHQRTWCYLCPIGTLSAWLGQNRQPLIVAAERCRGCDLCVSSCPMQLTPRFLAEQGGPARGDCLKCRLCVTSCPTSALTLGTGPCQDLAA